MRRHEMSPASFGQRSLGDPCFVADLAMGRSPSLRTADKVLVFMGFAPLGQAFVDEVGANLAITGSSRPNSDMPPPATPLSSTG